MEAPILPSAPAFPFVGMASARPGPQFVEQPGVHRMERLLTAHRGVVIRPSFDAWVQPGDQPRLGRLLLLVDDGGERLLVTADVRFAWLDDGLEPERLAASIVGGACLANPILAYLEAQKVEPDGIVVLIEGMSNPSFARLQFQSQLLQPRGDEFFNLMDHVFIRIQGYEIISIADQAGDTVDARAFPPAKSFCDCRFQSVKCYIRK